MKENFFIDQKKNEIVFDNGERLELYSKDGFRIISDLWVKLGWDQKHCYGFSWMGRPLIQIPDDALRIQEVIYDIKPDVVIETGIAHGGSLIFYASLCKAMGKGRIVGVDIEIRPHNRKAIESHEMFDLITLIEADAIADSTIDQVKSHLKEGETSIVILDSCHTYKHVLEELRKYSSMVSVGSYIVATDGSQEYLNETPRAWRDYPNDCAGWAEDNPKKAAEDFVKENPNFVIEEPKFPFNEGNIDFRITHWPSAFIKRVK